MPVYPNPAGGEMTVANRAEAEAKGWTPSMGTFGWRSDEGGGGGGGGGSAPAPVQGDASQLGGAIDKLLAAIQAGDLRSFNETVRQFNATFGLDQRKFDEATRQFNQNYLISQAGVTGVYQGQPTMQAQQQAYAQQLGVAQLAAQLQANPFQQSQVLGQANRILAAQPAAGFQAPGVVSGVGTAGGNQQGGLGYLQQIIEDIRNPTPNQTTADQFLANTPTPNKIDSGSFLRSAPSTQNLILQAMQTKYGLNPDDAMKQIQATLPQFQAPATVGQVRR